MNISKTKDEYIEPPRKKKKIKGKTVSSSFTVISLNDPKYNEPRPVTRGVVEFRDKHFYGKRLPRKNTILNASQGSFGNVPAIKFKRK
ncbi:12546_t:CDS:2 [Dentiscutata erythropus]|uniref:12546_t:CDS:1 n=1 Tax=Dentiscutata erythropus TaxID=1348616 RepID=A0A9N9B6T3_9GLOM|nr:12546_t:CDS:2 [Dentiscutata erythropus]